MPKLGQIAAKVGSGGTISREEAELLFAFAEDKLLMEMATSVRNRFHRPNEATYIVMSIINYTNVCIAACDYCAFFKLPHEDGTYLLGYDEVCRRIDKLKSLGGTLVDFATPKTLV